MTAARVDDRTPERRAPALAECFAEELGPPEDPHGELCFFCERVHERTDGAPQCPQCFARDMERQDDGTYACAAGCPGRAVEESAHERVSRAAARFSTMLGRRFVLHGV